jgi:hypothetical protein
MTNRLSIWVFTATVLLFAPPLRASHKSWVLKHTGGDCAFQSPQNHSFFGADGGDMVLFNHHDYSRTAVCPMAAAGRWGSSGSNSFGTARWAEAKRAWVHVYNGHPTAPLTCQAVARLRVSLSPGGSLYYGTARSVTGEGNHTLELVSGADPTTPPWTDWGGSLETNEGARLRSLDYQCTLPATGNYYSYIRGYGVAICQKLEGCFDIGLRFDSPGNEVSIQGNGSSCTSSNANIFRGADGLTASSSVGTQVSCPIVPPSDDSYEHASGYFKRLRVYFGGANGSTGCEQNGSCPRCYLTWERWSDAAWQSSQIFVWNSGGYVEMPLTLNGSADPAKMPVWSGAAINCVVPAGQRIRGYTAWASQTRVSGGQ